MQDYIYLMNEHFQLYPDDQIAYYAKIADYQFNDDIAKQVLMVKLNPNITDEKRSFVANGLRSFFKDKATLTLSLIC